MNTVKLILSLSVFAGVFSVLAETNDIAIAEAAAAQAKEDRIFKLLNTGSDPFRFEQGGGGSGSVSPVNIAQMDVTKVSASISVKGILILEGEEPQAMIKIGNGSAQLVQKDDLILIPASAPVKKHGKTVMPVNRVKYLIVKDISKDSIIVAPEQRPQELIKIR